MIHQGGTIMLANKNKKWALLAAAMLIAAAQAQSAFAADYDTHWAKLPIEKWKEAKIIGGYEDGSFKPNAPVTRAELAKMLSQVLGLTDIEGAKVYEDVKTSAWYYKDIAKISSLGIMNDDESSFSFRPGDYATREEAAYLIASAYHLTATSGEADFTDLDQIAPWAKETVMALRENGFINGKENNRFDPQGKLTRAEVAAMLDNITPNYISAPGTYETVKSGNVVVKSKDVILKGLTITGNLYLAQGIGEGDVTLENVTVNGSTYIAGGGINSILFKGSTLTGGAAVTAAHPVRVVSENSLVALKAATKTQTILTGSFSYLEVPAGAKVELKAAQVEGVGVIAGTGSQLADIKLDEASDITLLVAKTPVSITGKGKLQTLDVQSAGVTTEQKPAITQVKEGFTATIAGQKVDSTNSDKIPVAGGGGGAGAGVPAASLLEGLVGKVQLGSGEVAAQVSGNKIIFDLSGLSGAERLSGFTLSAGSSLKLNLRELDDSLTTNTNYGITDMIANTSTSTIKDKIGNSYSDAEIDFAKAIIGTQDDISLDKARNIANMVGDYTYTGTITDSSGNSETITIELKIN
jgi:hypothetical protein